MAKAVGVVTGLPVEAWIVAAAARRRGFPQPPMTVAAPGDAELTFRRTARLIADGAQGLVSFGLAGGLDPALSPGDLVLPREVLADGKRHSCDLAWIDALERRFGPSLSFSRGSLAAVDHPVQTAADKSALRAQAGAAAVDMESAIVARAAEDRGLPFICVRAVADPATQSLPKAALVALDGKGNFHLGRVVAALWNEPRDTFDLLRLARQLTAAARTLLAACSLAGPGFGLL
jgi:adenosylhomocysteine nucleosidase